MNLKSLRIKGFERFFSSWSNNLSYSGNMGNLSKNCHKWLNLVITRAKFLGLIFSASKHIYGAKPSKDILYRLLFLIKAVSMREALRPFLRTNANSLLGKLMQQRPEVIGAVVWPYQTNFWDAKTRLNRIEEHYRVLARRGYPFDIPLSSAIKLFPLHEIDPNLHVVIDQAKWFMREGQLVINLFYAERRIFSLAFSFAFEDQDVVAYVGAIQGRNIEGLLDLYRDITKNSHGMRPRDLMFEIFRMFVRNLGVKKIYAVADTYRHHRSDYFGKNAKNIDYSMKYDEVWEERGGMLQADKTCYAFDIMDGKKNLEDIPSKKRAAYRRRYELLDQIEQKILMCSRDLYAHKLVVDPYHSS